MGENCSLQYDLVIGNVGDSEHRPVIGNNVGFGLGCKVYGKLKIGDNATVLPNAVVTHDVPANAIVGGIPAKVIKFNNYYRLKNNGKKEDLHCRLWRHAG